VSEFSTPAPSGTDFAPSPSPGYVSTPESGTVPAWWDGDNSTDVRISAGESVTFNISDDQWYTDRLADSLLIHTNTDAPADVDIAFSDGSTKSESVNFTTDADEVFSFAESHVVESVTITNTDGSFNLYIGEMQPYLTDQHRHGVVA